jgi:tetratricopeptide (TPR) repeat protein
MGGSMRKPIMALSVLLTAAAFIASPAQAENRTAIAEACLKQNADTGIAACTRLITEFGRKLTPNLKAIVYTARGNMYVIKKNYDDAFPDFDEAIKLDPQSALAYVSRGYALNATHQYDRAIDDFDRGIQIQPGFASAFINRGAAFHGKHDYDRAVRDYDEAIKLEPRNVYAFNSRGIAYTEKGDRERALADFDEAIRLRPDFGQAYQSRGVVYHQAGDYDRAIRDDNEAIRLDPKSSELYNNRANEYLGKSEYDAAIRDDDEAIRINPNNASAYDTRGEARIAKGDYSGALIDLNEALRLNPNQTESYVKRATAYEKLGDIEHAKADYGTALARPGEKNPDTDKALEKARSRLAALQGSAVAAAPAAAPASTPIVAAAVPAPLPARPATPVADTGLRVALVIGNGGYKNVPALDNPPRDAAAVADALRKAGFQKVIVEDDLRKEKMETALREFGRVAEGADWALIYYAGHGIEMAGVNYLIPTDAKLETDRDVGFETVPLSHVMSAVEGAKKLRIVLLDACRDNPFANQMRRTAASRSIGRGLAAVEPQTGSLVVYAAKDGETALDGNGRNSPFVTALVKELAVPGVEIRKLFDLVRDDVLEATNNQQQPFTYGSVPGRQDFYFVAK